MKVEMMSIRVGEDVCVREDALPDKESSGMMNDGEDELPAIVDPKCQPYFLTGTGEKKGYNACSVLDTEGKQRGFLYVTLFLFLLRFSC